MPSKRFRIAFSFAGEKREFVEKVARILAERFGEDRILYDKYHNAEFSRSDLAFYLPDLYEKDADLIVAVFCPDYDKKEWCGLEWNVTYGLLKQRKIGEVMLTRFERVEGKGLRGLAGYTDLDGLTPQQAAAEILERLALNEGKPKDHYTKPTIVFTPRTSIPHNLPALQPFFGRKDELRKIAEALDPENRTWGALIDGPGGMGKTSLAVRAAYACTPEQFERIVFVSLKSRELDDDGLRDLSGFLISGLAELLNELARELSHANIAKAPDDQRPRLLLDALRATRTLLVLDNLESLLKRERDTVFTFVKRLPPGCKAILTSRGRIGSGAEELILEELSEDAALTTLAKLAETNPALARTSEAERFVLYRHTGGNPLLLRWTAGQIGRGHCVTFTDAIAYLRSCPESTENSPLEFIFGDLVEDFSPVETSVLCALTYFTLPAKLEHIVEIARDEVGRSFPTTPQRDLQTDGAIGTSRAASLTTEDIDRALRSLINRSLVVPSEELQTFALVPLVADFLRQKKPDVVAETSNRLEKRAYALAVENGYRKHDRLAVLDAAWPTVAAALPLFLAGPNDRLQTVCDALRFFLDFTGRWDEWLAMERDAECRAIAAEDFKNAGWRAFQTGWVHHLRGQSSEVLASADRAETHWREARAGPREQAIAVRLRGDGNRLAKDYPAAIAAYSEALKLHRTLGCESEDVTHGLNSLAEAERLSGDLDAAERDYCEALRVAHAINYREGIAAYTGNLAVLALDRENWLDAEAQARKALSLSEEVGRQQLIASNSHRLARALLRQGKKAEALPHAQRAVDIYARLGSPDLAAARQILAESERFPALPRAEGETRKC